MLDQRLLRSLGVIYFQGRERASFLAADQVTDAHLSL